MASSWAWRYLISSALCTMPTSIKDSVGEGDRRWEEELDGWLRSLALADHFMVMGPG